MRIWAISDLHLGLSTQKWMDKFGDHWKDHHLKVGASWRERVAPEDLVLLPGDFSWAMTLEEAAPEFQWLGQLPGKKVLIKGNHDYWWSRSHAKMQAALPPQVYPLKKKALILDGAALVGVRGCDFFPKEGEDPAAVAAEIERELREFSLSIQHLKTLGDYRHPPIALFHYPPFPMGACESPFTRMAEEAGCRVGIYGHLHSQEDWTRYFQGEFRGVHYQLVSCDFLDFAPVLISEIP